MRAWEVKIPYFRLDVAIEEDLIEEVARMYGYENIPSKSLSTDIPKNIENPIFDLLQRLKEALTGLGLTEIQTYSYYSTKVIENCKLKIENLVRIVNPISKETEYMRNYIWPNLIEVTAKNINHGSKDVAIFEIGKIYYKNEKGESSEKYSLAIVLMNGTDNPLSELHEIQKKLNLKTEKLERSVYFHPNRIIGSAAEVHKKVTDNFGVFQRVAILEICL